MTHNQTFEAFTFQQSELESMSIYQLCSLHRSITRLFDAVGAECERPCFENGTAGDFLERLWEFMGTALSRVTDALVNQQPVDADDAEMKARVLLSYDMEGEDLKDMVTKLSLAIQGIDEMRSHARTGSEV